MKSKRLDKVGAVKIKKKIKKYEEEVGSYKQVIYFLKSYGDGIAFLYLDGFSLKHTYYKVEDYTVRERAGFITASKGFSFELAVARKLIKSGIPVLLCDLTNVIRYADICLLVDSDPQLVEVKSSENQNKRTMRQQRNLQELVGFYNKDAADEFRGKGRVIRQAMKSSPVTHEEFMNSLMAHAMSEGFACKSPEHGLLYIAMRTKKFDCEILHSALEGYLVRPQLMFFLNEAKNSEEWLPLRSFTASLSRENVVPFIMGEIALMVLVDVGALKWHFDILSASATLLSDDNYALQIMLSKSDPNRGVFRVSRQMLSRIAFEFWSLQWFAAEQIELPESILDQSEVATSDFWQIPEDWLSLDDGVPIHGPN